MSSEVSVSVSSTVLEVQGVDKDNRRFKGASATPHRSVYDKYSVDSLRFEPSGLGQFGRSLGQN